MKIKRILIFCVLLLLMTQSIPAVYAVDGISVYLNDNALQFDVPPQIIEGRTMVPMRAIFEALGANVAWDDATKTVTATLGTKTVSMQIGKTELHIEDNANFNQEKAITLDVPPQITEGRTLVPVRAVAESFDCTVSWDAATRSVLISSINVAEVAPIYLEATEQQTGYLYLSDKSWYAKIDPSFALEYDGETYYYSNADGSEVFVFELIPNITPEEYNQFLTIMGEHHSGDEVLKEGVKTVMIGDTEFQTVIFTEAYSAEPLTCHYYFTVYENQLLGFRNITKTETVSQAFLNTITSFRHRNDIVGSIAFLDSLIQK